MDYAVNRSYSAGQGRFTQVDPIGMSATSIGNPQSNNLYAYVGNNPVDYTDPSGLNKKPDIGTFYVTVRAGEDPWDAFDVSFGGDFGWLYDPPIGWDPTDPPTGGDPGDIFTPPAKQPQEKISQDCITALTNLGVWDKVQEILKNPPLFDIDKLPGLFGASFSFFDGVKGLLSSSMANDPGVFFFGERANIGETVGQVFDRNTKKGQAWTVRGGGAIEGIYYRGSNTNMQDPYLLLHEVVHLVFPETLTGTVNLDKELVLGLNIQKNQGESDSDAVSRYFNSKCDPKIGGIEVIKAD